MEPQKRFRVVATFPINLGMWRDSRKHISKPETFRYGDVVLKPMHFLEAALNLADFVEPNQKLYAKILMEGHEIMPGYKSVFMGSFSAVPYSCIEASKIETRANRWQLLESRWFEVPVRDEPTLFWLWAGSNGGRATVALCTLLLGVEV